MYFKCRPLLIAIRLRMAKRMDLRHLYRSINDKKIDFNFEFVRPPGHNWPLDHVLDSLLTGPLIAPGSDVVRNVQAHCNAIQWETTEEKCWATHSSVSSRQACSPLGLEAQAVWWRSGPRRSYQSSHVEIFLRQCPQVLGQIYYWTLPHNSPVFRP